MSHERKALKEIAQVLDALENRNVQEKNVVIGRVFLNQRKEKLTYITN